MRIQAAARGYSVRYFRHGMPRRETGGPIHLKVVAQDGNEFYFKAKMDGRHVDGKADELSGEIEMVEREFEEMRRTHGDDLPKMELNDVNDKALQNPLAALWQRDPPKKVAKPEWIVDSPHKVAVLLPSPPQTY